MRPSRSDRRRVAVVLCVGGLLALAPAAPAAGAPGTPTTASGERPQLSIAITDGRASAHQSDVLDYTITIRNLGTRPVTGLSVTQTVPVGLGFVSASPHAVASNGLLVWQAQVPLAAATTLHSTMRLNATPASLLRLATVACVNTASTAPPIVCGTDSDQLPAGSVAASRDDATSSSSSARVWVIAGVVVVLLVVAGTALELRRRRHRKVVNSRHSV